MSRLEIIRPIKPGLLQRLAEQIRSITLGPYNSKDRQLARLFAGEPASTGIAVNEVTAMNYSAVWAAVSMISGSMASLPLVLYKRDGQLRERYTSHPLYRILHDSPNPEMSSFTLRETLTAHVLTWGNGYAEIERDGADRVRYLWPLTPDRVSPDRDRAGRLFYRVHNDSGPDTAIEQRNMLHVHGLSWDGMQGYSVISKARESIGLGVATERFGGTFFGNGSTFGGVFKHPNKMSDLARKNFREALNAQHKGVDRSHKFLVVEEGMEYERLGIPPNDAQFLETRQFQITEIARWFNIPPHKIADLTRSTNNNIEQQTIDYYQTTLVRWQEAWEQELMLKLISPLERNLQFIEHVTEGFLRGDAAARGEHYQARFNVASITPNQIRAYENENPIAGGDRAFVPLNFIPLDRVDEWIDAQIKEKTAPTTAPQPSGDREALAADVARLTGALDEARAEVEKVHRSAAEVVDAHVTEAVGRAEEKAGRIKAEEMIEKLHEVVAIVESQLRDSEDRRGIVEVGAAHLSELLDGAQTALAAEHSERALERSGLEEKLGKSQALEQNFRNVAGVAAEGLSTITIERDGLIVDRDTAVDGMIRLTAEAASAAVEKDAAIRQRIESEAAKAAAEQRAEAAERDKAIAEQAQAAANEAMEAQRQREVSRAGAVIAAHRALMVEAMGRMVRWEAEKAHRHHATPQKLRGWLETFYPAHAEQCQRTIEPIVRAHLAWMQADTDAAVIAKEIADAHCEESVKQLRDVLEVEDFGATLERMLTRWEERRPQAIADRLVREGVQHVRNV